MNARFVSLATGYALGGGLLRRKGVKQRPWLTLHRLETEAVYLRHQVRALQAAGGGTVRADIDMLDGDSYYDIIRARIHSPLLERVMDLLHPDGEHRLTPDAIQAAGVRGLASLWLDRGLWNGEAGELPMRTLDDAELIRSALHALGILSAPPVGTYRALRIGGAYMKDLSEILRPHVHRSMRHALRPGSQHGLTLISTERHIKRLPL